MRLLGNGWRDDARPRLARRNLAGLDLGNLAGGDAGRELLFWLGGSGLREGEEFLLEGDRAGDRTGGHADDRAERIAGLAGDGEDFEAVPRTVGFDDDAFLGFFLVEESDAVAAGDG